VPGQETEFHEAPGEIFGQIDSFKNSLFAGAQICKRVCGNGTTMAGSSLLESHLQLPSVSVWMPGLSRRWQINAVELDRPLELLQTQQVLRGTFPMLDSVRAARG
jgi:hypothetical protein